MANAYALPIYGPYGPATFFFSELLFIFSILFFSSFSFFFSCYFRSRYSLFLNFSGIPILSPNFLFFLFFLSLVTVTSLFFFLPLSRQGDQLVLFLLPFVLFPSGFPLFTTPYVSPPLSLGYPFHLTLFLSFFLVTSYFSFLLCYPLLYHVSKCIR